MKKILTALLVVLVLAAAGCGNSRSLKLDTTSTPEAVVTIINTEIAETAEKNSCRPTEAVIRSHLQYVPKSGRHRPYRRWIHEGQTRKNHDRI